MTVISGLEETGISKQAEWSTLPVCPSLIHSFKKGLNFKNLSLVFVNEYFVLCLCRD